MQPQPYALPFPAATCMTCWQHAAALLQGKQMLSVKVVHVVFCNNFAVRDVASAAIGEMSCK
jgi:hypothetical protein